MEVQDLVEAGYKPFKDPFKVAAMGYQLRVGHTDYFINVYYYDWTDFHDIPWNESYECELQFVQEDETTLNLSFSCTKMSVQELKDKCQNLFDALKCRPYE